MKCFSFRLDSINIAVIIPKLYISVLVDVTPESVTIIVSHANRTILVYGSLC